MSEQDDLDKWKAEQYAWVESFRAKRKREDRWELLKLRCMIAICVLIGVLLYILLS